LSQKPKQRERMICFCYSVSEPTIVSAIENGCTSLMDVRRETYASTGCAGCAEEVKKLLKKHVKKIIPQGSGETNG
jgi:NAD(P)H-nitrite reductase large subunit